MASANTFWPETNSLSFAASTTSTVFANPNPAYDCMLFTNMASDYAFVTWGATSGITAAFPVAGNTTGSFGVVIPPGAQISLRQPSSGAQYLAAVLLSGTGNVVFCCGDGV